jgi:hypothetical protein
MKHSTQANNCVRNTGDTVRGKHCQICDGYDNAVWLTQREKFEYQRDSEPGLR